MFPSCPEYDLSIMKITDVARKRQRENGVSEHKKNSRKVGKSQTEIYPVKCALHPHHREGLTGACPLFKDRLKVGKDGQRLLAIANRIQQGLDAVEAETRSVINPYIRKYGQMIKQDLLTFEIAPGSHISVLPGS